jgi:hypothetical protein
MKWSLCVSNDGYPVSLAERKLYIQLDDDKAERHGFVRIVDDSGEDYLYPKGMFVAMPIEQVVERLIMHEA